jgi:hypothetical protein
MMPVTLVGESKESESPVFPFTVYHLSRTACPDSFVG